MNIDPANCPQHDSPIVIVEPNPSGHRFDYVRLLAEAALQRSRKVILATSKEAASAPEFELHLSGIASQIEIVFILTSEPSEVASLERRVSAALTVIPDGDHFAIKLAKRGSWEGGRLTLLIMRESAQPKRIPGTVLVRSILKRIMVRRAAALRNVRVLTLRSATAKILRSDSYVKDPVVLHCSPGDIERARLTLTSSNNTYWFGVLGAVTERKNVALIAESLSQVSGANLGLLIAGRISPSVLDEAQPWFAAMREKGHLVAIVNKFLTDEELDAYVDALDCVVLAHSNEGPSGLLGKAIASGTRVIASGARSLRRDTVSIGEGASWVPLNKHRLARAFEQASGRRNPPKLPLSPPTDFAEAILG